MAKFLRHVRNEYVSHRDIPDTELDGIVNFVHAVSDEKAPQPAEFKRQDWPDYDEMMARTVMAQHEAAFDLTDTGVTAADALAHLFAADDIKCVGATVGHTNFTRTVNAAEVARLQFIVPNPMRGRGRRCQDNVRCRNFIVVEIDEDVTQEEQAVLMSALGSVLPLTLVVDSGNKSLHAWYDVRTATLKAQRRFFGFACVLGADASRWDVCGWVRMPGGTRYHDGIERGKQAVLYMERG
jgi:hypothetical protein